jgi:hypothetical protein
MSLFYANPGTELFAYSIPMRPDKRRNELLLFKLLLLLLLLQSGGARMKTKELMGRGRNIERFHFHACRISSAAAAAMDHWHKFGEKRKLIQLRGREPRRRAGAPFPREAESGICNSCWFERRRRRIPSHLSSA